MCYYSFKKAFYWCQKAAENGYTNAAKKFLSLYQKAAEYVHTNAAKKYFYLYQKAAENGEETAMFNLAICYENGEGYLSVSQPLSSFSGASPNFIVGMNSVNSDNLYEMTYIIYL
ncbi:unnamed protein product [Rhizophagus irregularis]|nr:unnamed protein product [Rhizophagus irregularis]CAB5298766.1 unnamed protein product [Rhizophagus irregularis]